MLEDASMLSSLVLAQATLLILIVAIVATGVLAYVFQNREHNSDKKLSKAESTLQFTEKDLGRIESNYWGLYHENERLKVEVKEWQDRHSALFTDFDRLYRDGLLERWFIFLERSYFRNRAEISAFLFLPMLWFLEYPESAFHLDEPIPLLVRTQMGALHLRQFYYLRCQRIESGCPPLSAGHDTSNGKTDYWGTRCGKAEGALGEGSEVLYYQWRRVCDVQFT